MIGDVRKLLHAKPFVPFSVVTSAGQKYRVPTPDHAGFSPSGTRLVVWFDDDSHVALAGLHLAALEIDAAATAA
jgi:hypothetical protein